MARKRNPTRRANAPSQTPKPAPPEPPPGSRWFWAAVGIAALLGAGLRLYRIADRGLWIDEVTSLRTAAGALSPRSPHFLSVWLVRQALRLGDSPFFLRLPSVLAGIAGIPAFAWMLRRWFTPAVGVVGALLLAVNPYHLYFSGEARYYAEIILLSCVALGLWPSLVPRPRPWALGAFTACAAALYAVHPTTAAYSLILVLALSAVWAVEWRRRPRHEGRAPRRLPAPVSVAAVCAAGALAVLALWLIGPLVWNHLLRSNLAAWLSGKPLHFVQGVGWNARFLAFPFAYGTVYCSNPTPWLPPLVGGLFLVGWVWAGARRSMLAALMFATWVGSLLFVWMYAGSTVPFDSKYVSYTFPLYLGLAAYGLVRGCALAARIWPGSVGGRARVAKLATVAAVVGVLAAHVPIVGYVCRGEYVGYLKALKWIAAAADGPAEVYVSTQGLYIMGYYLPRLGLDRIHLTDLRQLGMDRSERIAEASLKRDLYRGTRPWMVAHAEMDAPLTMRIRDRLRPWFDPAASFPTMASSGFDVAVERAKPFVDADKPGEGGVPLYAFDAMWPRHNGWDYADLGGRRVLTLFRNSSLHYRARLPNDGAYRLGLTAWNDGPPALVEAAVDDKPLGVMAWRENTQQFDTRTLDFATSAGVHDVAFSFLSASAAQPDGGPGAPQAALSQFSIQPIDRGARMEPRDDFLSQARVLAIAPAFYAGFAHPGGPNDAGAVWRLMGDAKRIEPAKTPPGELGLSIPPNARSAGVISPVLPVKPSLWLYGSFDLKTVDLINHTANIVVVWLTAGTNQERLQYAYATGVNQTTGWMRLPYLTQVPEGVDRVAVGVYVYPNSNRPSDHAGQVWLRHAWGPGR
ncbi:MAG: glycosyltransferase family 39 protein [Candidatus Sumerlaeota bacterium]|nr:glycosyltransferase family 39 protein [Candidatus Sumerlaeota bacterium]